MVHTVSGDGGEVLRGRRSSPPAQEGALEIIPNARKGEEHLNSIRSISLRPCSSYYFQSGDIPIAVKLAKMDDGDEYNRAGATRHMLACAFLWPGAWEAKDGALADE